jgi:hypothetical protein
VRCANSAAIRPASRSGMTRPRPRRGGRRAVEKSVAPWAER